MAPGFGDDDLECSLAFTVIGGKCFYFLLRIL